MFSKSPNNLNAKDIEKVISEAWRESDNLEFKGSLPSKSGDDPWITSGKVIGERAKREILSEIVAFANAYGGWLMIGIQERNTKPARAKEINPIPNCVELADRISLLCRDCIEPQIQFIEIAGVPLEADGSGVVVIYVPNSMLAPHRSRRTKECYFRHADRTEPMTMREIQDLTLQIDRGSSAIKDKFQLKQSDFHEEAIRFDATGGNSFGARVTLCPLSKIGLSAVHNIESLRPPMEQLAVYFKTRGAGSAYLPDTASNWKPRIRGTIARGGDNRHFTSRELTCDGLIEYRFYSRADDDEPPILFVGWMLGIFCNSLCAAEIFRQAAGSPNVAYALEAEIYVIQSPVKAGYYHGSHEQFFGAFQQGSILFPHYPVGRKEDFSDLTQSFEIDFWHGAEREGTERIGVDFETAFEKLGLN